MGKLAFEVAHALSRQEARARMEKLTAHWAAHGVMSTWSGDEAQLSGKVMGMHLDAQLRVSDRSVGGEATDPGLLLRGQARKYLVQKVESYLDPKTPLADLQGS